MIERVCIGVYNDNRSWPQVLKMRFFLSYFVNFGIVSSVKIMFIKKLGQNEKRNKRRTEWLQILMISVLIMKKTE